MATAESQEDTGVAREGEDTPNLDLGDQGDSEVTREGEDTPKLDQGDRGDTEHPESVETQIIIYCLNFE